ncbi:MAG: NAD+ synthase [Deltaproteobacteria bacterium]|nr:NAD+ synthase [Deltaproteobacteria bacterium]
MKMAIAQINTTIGDFDGNGRRIEAEMAWARVQGARLVVFPELTTTGYPPRDCLGRPIFVEQNLRLLEALAKQATDISVVLGYVGHAADAEGPWRTNSVALLAGGKIAATRQKTLLPAYDVFDETRYFVPATTWQPVACGPWQLGLTICEDAWHDATGINGPLRYHVDPLQELQRAGATCILNISASPFMVGKRRMRQELLAQAARRYGLPMVYVNLVGGNDQLVFDGGSFVVNRRGEVTWCLERFVEAHGVIDAATLDGPAMVQRLLTPVEATVEALQLGLRDYLRKCGFRSVLIGLSGGIDSAVVAALAVAALGSDAVTGIAMPSPYSSAASLADAEALARNLGMHLDVMPIDTMYETYRDRLGTDRHAAPDLADENLQARIRGTILMTLSNRTGAMVLSTGNKSELAVGYCTLYGDMVGGLALLSDVPKTMVYALAAWINREQPLIPPSILQKPPSAELRPGQVDQETLPPYPLLDAILTYYIEDHRSIDEIIDMGLDANIVHDVIYRVNCNEYKRRQAAPGIQISRKAFGIGRRFPIAMHLDR